MTAARWWLAIATCCVATNTARAQPAFEAITLHYQAPAGCPSRAQFVGELRARNGRVRVEPAGAARRIFEVSIARDGEQYLGTLTVRDAERGDTRRELTATACDRVVFALALVAAVAADPRPPPPATSARGVGSSRMWAVGASAGAVGGATPDGLAVGGAFVEVRGTRLAGRLGVAGGVRNVGVAGGGRARFAWVAGRADVCPVVGRWGGSWHYSGCARLEVGALRAEGSEVEGARSRARPWVAPGLVGGIRWNAANMFVGLEVSANVAAVRDRFFVAPDVTVHDVPVVVGGAAVVLGLVFL